MDLYIKQSIPALIERLHAKNDHERRAVTCELIARGKEAVPFLISALESNNIAVRINTEDVLSRIGIEAMKKLKAKLPGSLENEWLCGRIARVLSRLGFKPAADAEAACYDLASGNHNNLSRYGEAAADPLIKSFAWYDEVHVRKAKKLIKRIGFPAFGSLTESCSHLNQGIRAHSIELVRFFCRRIQTMFIGMPENLPVKKNKKIWINPDVRNMILPLEKLRLVIIESKDCDLLNLERFLTYAANYIDEKYLKTRVAVKILGTFEELNPGHVNILKGLFKSVSNYSDE